MWIDLICDYVMDSTASIGMVLYFKLTWVETWRELVLFIPRRFSMVDHLNENALESSALRW